MQLGKILKEIDLKIAGSMGKKREGLLEARDIIRKHLSSENAAEIARSSRDNDGWIPVEERLPENGDDVLVQWEFYSRCDNMTYTYIHIMRLNKMTGEWNGTYGVPNGKVIAWRPLPEPYRPERSVK